MSAAASPEWLEANQRYLVAALRRIQVAMEHRLATEGRDASDQMALAEHALEQAAHALPAPSALEQLCARLGLTPFERDVLLLCAGIELDARFANTCAGAQGDPRRGPTFSLALAALPQAHWSALLPTAPLRRHRLVEIGAGDALTQSPLRIDERVLHYLAGIDAVDERLHSILVPVNADADLPASHATLARRLSALLSQAAQGPAINLCGPEEASQRAIAGAACTAGDLRLYLLEASDAPQHQGDREIFLRLWMREVLLADAALLLHIGDGDSADAQRAALALVERLPGVVLLASRESVRLQRRPVLRLDVGKATAEEQRALWAGALGDLGATANGYVDRIVSQFSLSRSSIQAASRGLDGADDEVTLGAALWDACRAQARPRLDDLAQRIEATATWDDLVLPEPQRLVLQEIAAHLRQRAKVYDTWGFGNRSSRGLGLTALFSGLSGTGKTMAAEVLAAELRLDLYRIDLSQVVSKYIGETEKNLRRVFDAAEEGGAILLFDEADALFGKRSEVKDSHDRYANIEVSYLLQRMEAYRGLAILTTNLKGALDTAFLRRIRFVVQFPFPAEDQRVEIWRRVFPPQTPTEGLNASRLARLDVAGGNIRNIALNAAFLAADAGEPVRMSHVLRAAKSEYAKLERPLNHQDLGGWA